MIEYYKTDEYGYLTVLDVLGDYWCETGSDSRGPWDFIVLVSKAVPYKTQVAA